MIHAAVVIRDIKLRSMLSVFLHQGSKITHYPVHSLASRVILLSSSPKIVISQKPYISVGLTMTLCIS